MIEIDHSEESQKGRTAFSRPFDARIALDGTVVEVPTSRREGLDLDGLAYPDGAPGSDDPTSVKRFMSTVVDTVFPNDPVSLARARVEAAINTVPPRTTNQL